MNIKATKIISEGGGEILNSEEGTNLGEFRRLLMQLLCRFIIIIVHYTVPGIIPGTRYLVAGTGINTRSRSNQVHRCIY